MSTVIKQFGPSGQGSYAVAASAVAADQAVTQPTAPNSGGSTNLRILNACTVVALVSWGMTSQSGVVSATTSYPVAPGATTIVDMGFPATHVGVILASTSTGTVYLSVGEGT